MAKRCQVWSRVAVVLEEKPITKAKTSKGLRVEARFNEVTYELECGHVVTRQHPRLEPTREPGHSIRCEYCSAGSSGKAVACG